MENRSIKNDRNELRQLEPWEFQYYAYNFNCTEEELKTALSLVGNVPAELSQTLSK